MEIFIQDSWERDVFGKEDSRRVTASARVGKDSHQLYRQKGLHRTSSGRRFPRERFFLLRDWLVFLLRDWLVWWVWAEMALISGPTVFLSLVFFSLLALILRPGHISFTGSDSRDKVCFFDTSFKVRMFCLVLGSGIKCFFHWLRF